MVVPFIPELLPPSFAASASKLRTLLFVGSVYRPDSDASTTSFGHPYPFPALEHLESAAILSRPVLHLCTPTLKVLSLRRQVVPRGAQQLDSTYFMTLLNLTRALSHTPLLEYLDVELPSGANSTPIFVELLRLKTLRLVGNVRDCALFLRFVRVPGNIDVRVCPKKRFGV